jgi:hypothetical protein
MTTAFARAATAADVARICEVCTTAYRVIRPNAAAAWARFCWTG